MSDPRFISLDFQPLSTEEQTRRAEEFYEMLERQRTVREFSYKKRGTSSSKLTAVLPQIM